MKMSKKTPEKTTKICCDCKEEKSVDEFYKQSKGNYRSYCKSCYKIRTKKYDQKNPEQVNQRVAKYYKKNPEKCYTSTINAKLKKQNRVPSWLTPEQYQQIEFKYRLMKKLNKAAGFRKYSIDHIIPLNGVNNSVSGLHVPWNLRIVLHFENATKYNFYNKDGSVFECQSPKLSKILSEL